LGRPHGRQWDIAENVGMGQTASSIEAGFASSGPHYANMTNSQVSQVGVGVVPSNGALWVVEDFWGNGSSSGPPPPPPPPRVFPPTVSRSASAPRPTLPPAPPTTTAAAVTTTTTAAPPVDLDSAAQQVQYFDAWD
jgi:hypothetical protein